MLLLIAIAVIELVCSNFGLVNAEEETTTFNLDSGKTRQTFATHSPVNDSNWAGYIIGTDLQNPKPTITGVSASWIVPYVVPSVQADKFSAIWIGIGGFFDSTLIQVGTEQDSVAGQVEYSAWYELLPQTSITIGSVSPGDLINAAIKLENANLNTWSISIKDVTANETFYSLFNYTASKLSAEWVVERPVVGRTLSALANVGTVTFTGCQSTVGGTSGALGTFPHTQTVMYDTILNTNGLTQLTAVSDLTTDGSSFTVETSRSAIPELHTIMALIPLMTIPLLFTSALKRRQFSRKEQ